MRQMGTKLPKKKEVTRKPETRKVGGRGDDLQTRGVHARWGAGRYKTKKSWFKKKWRKTFKKGGGTKLVGKNHKTRLKKRQACERKENP